MADELERQATTDPITGLLNHRYGDVALDEALEQARSRGSPLSVLIGDMDDFKLFNDTFGHPLGDEVLRLVAGVFRQMSGDSGIASRYGGDEFLVVLPGADRAAASAFADRLSAAVGVDRVSGQDGRRVPIGLSLGVASFPEDSESKDRLLVLADAAMYEAKRLGGIDRQEPCVVDAGGVGVESVFGALDSLVQAVQYRDHYTKTHSDLVAEYAAKLALRVGFSEEATRAIRIAGILHDVGKLIVPDDILKKPGPLTAEEREVIQRHPLVGETLIRETPFLEDVIQAVGCHHEHYDGAATQGASAGDEIPLLGRALAIADAYSAMSLDRPYRKALSEDEIVAEFEAGAGTKFDPHLVEVFVEMLLGGKARPGRLKPAPLSPVERLSRRLSLCCAVLQSSPEQNAATTWPRAAFLRRDSDEQATNASWARSSRAGAQRLRGARGESSREGRQRRRALSASTSGTRRRLQSRPLSRASSTASTPPRTR